MIVFDSSTLILIARIELLDIVLNNLPMEAAVPKAVEEECCRNKNTLDALMIQKSISESRVQVRPVRSSRTIQKLKQDFNMGRGESEVIALALQEKAALVGIDDKQGINACRLTGLPFTTAVALLIRSRQKGLLDKDDALDRLARLALYGRYKASILQDAKLRLEVQP